MQCYYYTNVLVYAEALIYIAKRLVVVVVSSVQVVAFHTYNNSFNAIAMMDRKEVIVLSLYAWNNNVA